jgi:phosphotransferase system enzyme I (PtsI)
MGLILSGIGVSRGVAIGKAHLLRRDEPDVAEHTIPRPLLVEEIKRFQNALRRARQQLKVIRNRIPAATPPDILAFVDAHLLMLDDAALAEVPIQIIRDRRCNAEWALQMQRDALVRVFDEMDDPYLRTRRDDVDHVINRIQGNLSGFSHGHDGPAARLSGKIVIAEDVSPAETLLMQQQGVAALVTEFGGHYSHTAILARSLGIPAVVGVHNAGRFLMNKELLVVDAEHGTVVAAPDVAEIDHYRRRQAQGRQHQASLARLKDEPAVTRDGHAIALLANIEIPEDLPAVKRSGAGGVGLYRTEMLFMNREQPPSEDEQLEVYVKIVRGMKGAPVTIRTLDLGADKQVRSLRRTVIASNPALGLRAIRSSLKDPGHFVPQLRAILRASAYGRVRLMIPMLSTVLEMQQVLRLIDEQKAVLRSRRQKYDTDMAVGCMIEVPAAALAARVFARHVDFFSIGTNDLIQYTLAVDRLDEEVNYLYDPLHPAILQLIKMTIAAGRRAGIPVAMCGEMAGDVRYTRLLLGMGLREFSSNPASLLEVKHVVNGSNVEEMARTARRVLRLSTPQEVASLVARINAKG